MRKPNYDKFPSTPVSGGAIVGWQVIVPYLADALSSHPVVAIDLYVGANEEEIISAFLMGGRMLVDTRRLMKSETEIKAMTDRFMTDDVLFGHMSNLTLEEYFDPEKVAPVKEFIQAGGQCFIIGIGASLFCEQAPVVYVDMARWEIQMRFRRHEAKALGIDNSQEAPSLQYKRGYFNDWNVCDAHKDQLIHSGRILYWLDTHQSGNPRMITNDQFLEGMRRTVQGPFRVVPFFDPAPWGGQWMKEVCDLDRESVNYGWCFDCVPEENSLYLDVSGVRFELPSKDVVLVQSQELLGERVEARFGKEFPIRFDFLDTMGGGNLSLQVHPTNEFSHHHFGLHYTQDESYYLLDAGEDAVVYLGVKTGVDADAMIHDLREAQKGNLVFDAEKYVNKIPARKHDHYLIPAGTIHCSGHESMVLEISSTPSIFTFKLWDWQRLGLDGKPRPINVERGRQVINWNRNTEYVYEHLRNHITVLRDEPGLREERTGLHPNEFIETRRHTFSQPVLHHTEGGVNVLNLIDGEEAIIESPTQAFEPFVVHYAETFIIPASVGAYTIRPYGRSEGQTCMTIKAYVR